MSLFDIFLKSSNSERTDFCRAMEQKNGFRTQITTKITLFQEKNFFINMFFKISKNMTVSVKKVRN